MNIIEVVGVLGSFRVRMLLVIVIVTLVGLSVQSGHRSKEIVEPVIKYILQDCALDRDIATFIENMHRTKEDEVPVTADNQLQVPCEFIRIERNFGWYWNQDKNCQEFSPGVDLQVEENTDVRSILEGKVLEIKENEDGLQVFIEHGNGFYSFYGGLKEVSVAEKAVVKTSEVLGKTGKYLHFEVRNQEGPLNPQQLFE